MMDLKDSIEVYLYKVSKDDGELVCLKGCIPDYENSAVAPSNTYFKTREKNKNGYNSIRYHNCSTKEGTVFNGCLWFKEPNEKKAATLLSMYYEKEMEKLQARMDKIIDKLESLDDVLKEEEN